MLAVFLSGCATRTGAPRIKGRDAMNHIGAFLIGVLFSTACLAEPMVTISCPEPMGFNMEYGASIPERAKAELEKKSEPRPQLRGPTKDGYLMNPTFVVDSSKKTLTIVWAESAADAKLRKFLKAANLPAPSLPAAGEADIVLFAPDHISALQVIAPHVVTVYSFFPKLGTAFFTTQSQELSGKNARVMSVFSACTYSWSSSR
jgi:hypothetical protein